MMRLEQINPLSSIVLVNEVITLRASPLSDPAPFPGRVAQFVVPAPATTNPIAIDRVFSRIHLHNSEIGNPTETVLALIRASDGSLFGGVIADEDRGVAQTNVEREFKFDPASKFVFFPGDAIVVQTYRFVHDVDLSMTDNNNMSVYGIFAVMAYHQVVATPRPPT